MGNSVMRMLTGRQKVRVLMLGLDNAGKTSYPPLHSAFVFVFVLFLIHYFI